MNELMAVLSFIGFAIAVVVAAQLGKTALFVLSTTFIVISNVTVQMPVTVFGMEISWAIIIYSLVYFITDILCEYHGRTNGYRLAAANLAVQLILWAYVYLSLQVTPVDSGKATYETMQKLFGTTAQITFAAIVASAGPFLDIFVFSWIRHKWDTIAKRHIDENTAFARFFKNRLLALVARNKLSTFAGQIVNTIIFFTLALFDAGIPTETLVSIIVSASVIKVVIALADIPFLVAVEKFLHLRRQIA